MRYTLNIAIIAISTQKARIAGVIANVFTRHYTRRHTVTAKWGLSNAFAV